MERDRGVETARAQLNAIRITLEELLRVADDAEDYLLGAKLADSQMCVVDRLADLGMSER
jgi:hypothetical protein